MKPWQHSFIIGLRDGKHPAALASLCAGMPLAAVQALREEDPEFNMLWEEAVGEADAAALAGRELTPAALERVLVSQLADKEIAAYFGMPVDDFLAAVNDRPNLKRVYDFGRDAAKVAIGLAQFDNASAGHADMQKWYGKQHMNQSDGGSNAPAQGMNVVFNITNPGDSYRRMLQGGLLVVEDKTAEVPVHIPEQEVPIDQSS